MPWTVWFLVALICLHIYQRLTSRRARRMLAKLPSFGTLPFVGNMHSFIGIKKDLYQGYVDVSKIIEEKNMPFLIWVGNLPFVALTDPDDLRAVSASNLDKTYIYDFAKELLGDGLISAHGAIWKQNIKKLGVAFKPSNVDAFQEIFNQQSQLLIGRMQTEINGDPFNMLHKYLYITTLRIIAESAFGVSVDDTVINDEFNKSFLRILEILILRLTNVHLQFDVVFRLTPVYREYIKCVKTVHGMTEMVMKRVQSMANEGNHELPQNPQNTRDSRKPSMKSFLEILLEMKETNPSLTDQQIKYEVTTILMAGHETVATALNFILLAIGCRPDVQTKMCDEISHVFGDTVREVSKDDLSRLSYCEAVIYETMRLYPPVPGCLREVDHDVQLKSCVLPKGTLCGFNLFGSGRSSRVWGSDAMVYNPERWLDPSTTAKNVASFMGFSTGKRVCIGKRYSFNLVKTMLVHLLTEYEFISDSEKMTLQIDVLVKPITGNLIQIRRRRER